MWMCIDICLGDWLSQSVSPSVTVPVSVTRLCLDYWPVTVWSWTQPVWVCRRCRQSSVMAGQHHQCHWSRWSWMTMTWTVPVEKIQSTRKTVPVFSPIFTKIEKPLPWHCSSIILANINNIYSQRHLVVIFYFFFLQNDRYFQCWWKIIIWIILLSLRIPGMRWPWEGMLWCYAKKTKKCLERLVYSEISVSWCMQRCVHHKKM